MQTGNNISVSGLSDFYLNANYKVSSKVNLTIGMKFPFNDGNKKRDGLSLPMDYQSSLGTVDFIAGIGLEIKKIKIVAAIQQPLIQNNNEFINGYIDHGLFSRFHSTYKFKRSGDVLLRVSYPMELGEKFMLTPGILPIYHLRNDKFTDDSGVEQEITGSQGLTFNGNVYLDYAVNTKNYLQFSIGAPFVVRESRPDGLTRHFIVNLEYRIKF
jgi:hypothetical protein